MCSDQESNGIEGGMSDVGVRRGIRVDGAGGAFGQGDGGLKLGPCLMEFGDKGTGLGVEAGLFNLEGMSLLEGPVGLLTSLGGQVGGGGGGSEGRLLRAAWALVARLVASASMATIGGSGVLWGDPSSGWVIGKGWMDRGV